MKATEAHQTKAQRRSWRGELGPGAKGLISRPQGLDCVPAGNGEPWKVFSSETPWPDSGAVPC